MDIGINLHAAWPFYEANPGRRGWMLDQLKAAGFTQVRVDFEWRVMNPAPGIFNYSRLDPIIADCDSRNMKVLLLLYNAPQHASGSPDPAAPPKDPAAFGLAAAAAAIRHGPRLAGIEMWNEPDLAKYWTGTAAAFTAMLKASYPIAKHASPGTLFVMGAPTYLGLASGWIAQCYAAGAGHGITHDMIGIHPYPSPANLPPDSAATFWSIRGINSVVSLMDTAKDPSLICASEIGYSTHPDYVNAKSGKVENWERGVTETQQADYTVRALAELGKFPRVASAMIYVDRDMPGASLHEANFGLWRADWTPKPAVAAIAKALTAPVPPPAPDPTSDLRLQIGQLLSANSDLKTRLAAAESALTDLRAIARSAGQTLTAAAQ